MSTFLKVFFQNILLGFERETHVFYVHCTLYIVAMTKFAQNRDIALWMRLKRDVSPEAGRGPAASRGQRSPQPSSPCHSSRT